MKLLKLKSLIPFASAIVLGVTMIGCGASDSSSDNSSNSTNIVDCQPTSGESVTIAASKLYIEHNGADEDTGVHGLFDDHGWSELCVYDPTGKLILAVKPQNELKDLTMAGIFFESREPENSEFSIEELKKQFPEGEYQVRGVTYEGKGLIGSATFSHNIPQKPEILSPATVEDVEEIESALVDIDGLEVSWNPITTSLDGKSVDITGYQVIITKEEHTDSNGLSRPIYDVHVPSNVIKLSVAKEFLENNTAYEIEILALEKSGNQTINVGFFKTK